jgi:hypothetical protein
MDTSLNRMDSFLLNRKGLVGILMRKLLLNENLSEDMPLRKDILLKKYDGKIIRNIVLRGLPFGVPFADTSRKAEAKVIQIAESLHTPTRKEVIRNNLFFKKGDRFQATLVSDNEKHFRDLHYLRDASISVIREEKDSVDVLVMWKDVLSLGVGLQFISESVFGLSLIEDNFKGTGHSISLHALTEKDRRPHFGSGGDLILRNIKGSFTDGYAGFETYNNTINTGNRNEKTFYAGLLRPLVHPYLRFTFGVAADQHTTLNAFPDDTLYESDHRYRFYNYEIWGGWNVQALKVLRKLKDDRLRMLLGLRYFQQQFSEVPIRYQQQYYYLYPDISGTLASVTLFRQDFYKARYIYGFGRNEDIPEGLDIAWITGWTKKSGINRLYYGVNAQRFFFTANENYFRFTLKADGFARQQKMEDMNLMFNVEHLSRLLHLGTQWRQRYLTTFSVARQFRTVLNEPLFLQSDFGLQEWSSDTATLGHSRITLKTESVFYSGWHVAYFYFAPFVAGSICLFTPMGKTFAQSNWYQSISFGLRTRNESLVFNTIELRGYFFPVKNFRGRRWDVEVNTNIRFKYNKQFIKKSEIINVN